MKNLFIYLCVLFHAAAFSQYGLADDQLHEAAYQGDLKKVKSLTSRSAKHSIDAPAQNETYQGLSPLSIAVYAGHSEIVQFLLKEGANPNFVSSDGFTPLLIAVKQQNVAMVSELIQFLSKNPEDLATALNQQLPIHEVVVEDKKKSRTTNEAHQNISNLFRAMAVDDPFEGLTIEQLEEARKIDLIKGAADPCFETEESKKLIPSYGTPLHLAASQCHLELSQILIQTSTKLKLSLDPMRALDHATPLRLALYSGCIDVSNELIKNDSKLNRAISTSDDFPLLLQKVTKANKTLFKQKFIRALSEKNSKLARFWLIAYSQGSESKDIESLFATTIATDSAKNHIQNALNDLFPSDCATCTSEAQCESCYYCAICLEKISSEEFYQGVSVTPCNHLTHEICLKPWVEKHSDCPTCRTHLLKGNANLIFTCNSDCL